MDELNNQTEQQTEVKTEQKQTETQTQNEGLFTQSDLDKKITEAIKTREKKLNEQFEKKMADELAKQKSLSTLSEEDRQKVELDEKIKMLEAKEREISFKELKSDFVIEVNKLNLPIEAAELLLTQQDTAETAFQKLNSFKEIVEKASEAFLKQKMADNTFTPNVGKQNGITVEDFKKMDYNQKHELYTKNKPLFDELSAKMNSI